MERSISEKSQLSTSSTDQSATESENENENDNEDENEDQNDEEFERAYQEALKSTQTEKIKEVKPKSLKLLKKKKKEMKEKGGGEKEGGGGGGGGGEGEEKRRKSVRLSKAVQVTELELEKVNGEGFRKRFVSFSKIHFVKTSLGEKFSEDFGDANSDDSSEGEHQGEEEDDGSFVNVPFTPSEDDLLHAERLELENLALALFERGQLKLDYFETSKRSRVMTQEFVESAVEPPAMPCAFFRVKTLASKAMRLYLKNLAGEYLVKVLRDQIVAIAKEVDEKGISVGASLEEHFATLERMCGEILSAILGSRSSLPPAVESLCKFLYSKIYEVNPGQVVVGVADFLFARFFCVSLIQLGAYHLLPPGFRASSNTKGVLLLISQVLQRLAANYQFDDQNKEQMRFNPFIERRHGEVLDYFYAFAGTWERVPMSLNVGKEDLEPLLSVLVGKLQVAIHVNNELQFFYTALPSAVMVKMQLLLASDEIDTNGFVEIMVEPSMDFVSALCAISDSGSQTDSVAEAIIVTFDIQGKAAELIEWILLDEITGTGRTQKRQIEKTPSKEAGEVRSGPILVPVVAQLGKGKMPFLWKQRWAVLNSDTLRCYPSQKSTKVLLVVHLKDCDRIDVKGIANESDSKAFYFNLNSPTKSYKFGVMDGVKVFDWVNDINSIIQTITVQAISKTGEKVYHEHTEEKKQEAKLLDVQMLMEGDAPERQFKTRLTVDPAMFELSLEGILHKQGGPFKDWKRRHFVLNKGFLSYYRPGEEEEALGVIDLENCIRIGTSKKIVRCLELEVPGRVYILRGKSDDEMFAWLAILQKVVYFFRPTNAQVIG